MSTQSVAHPRRRRTWAPTADTVPALARSARQLARVSASRIALPQVKECLAKYRYATAVEQASKLIRGDLLVVLIDGHGLRAIDIARETGERPGDISQMYSVGKTFPRETRPNDAPYNHLLLATRMLRKFPSLGMTPAAALGEIRRVRLTQHRDVTRYFSMLECGVKAAPARQLPDLRNTNHSLNRAHHCRFQELLPALPNGSVQILGIDPPYVYGDSTYRSRSARSLACDSGDATSAIGVVTDLLRDWQPKLAPGGVVLLWQPWQNLSPEISHAIDLYRWVVHGPVIWDKGRPQPGNFTSPYSTQGEMLWVLHRPGDTPINYDGSSREMILRFAPVSFPGHASVQSHAFEKPQNLCESLIRKHSRPGDLVFDACGCTGALTVAAINSGRCWVYAESNAENFALGAKRIAACLAKSDLMHRRGPLTGHV
jgi:DNA modification methylase